MKIAMRFISLAILGAAALSLAVIAPAFSATGTVRFYDIADTSEDQEWARQGGQVGLEVEDPDLDTLAKLVNLPNQSHPDCDECIMAEKITLTNRHVIYLSNIPIVDSGVARGSVVEGNEDGFINENDVRLVDKDGVDILDSLGHRLVDRLSPDGRVDLTEDYTGTFYALYWGWNRDDTGEAVRVKSQAYPEGIVVTLTETRTNSGVFRAVIDTDPYHTYAESSPPTLRVDRNDVITLTYADEDPSRSVSATLTVESTPPTFSRIIPEHDSSDRREPEIEFDVTDSQSGIADADDIWVIFAVDNDSDGVVGNVYEYQVDEAPKGDVDEEDGVFSASQGLPSEVEVDSDATIYWWALARDSAGNLGILDRQPRIDGRDNPCYPSDFPRDKLSGEDVTVDHHVAGCQPYAARIDNTGPVIDRRITGPWWDTSKSGDDKTEYDSTKARNDSILVVFSEPLDASSVHSSDFRVDGATPLKAQVFSGREDYVFLTVPPLAADAQPTVELVGDVLDKAGNHEDSDGSSNPQLPDPTPVPTLGSLDFLIAVLREAGNLEVLSDELASALSDWFIVNSIAPATGETANVVRQRLSADDTLDTLIAVLREAGTRNGLSDTLADLLSDWFIANLIVPATGETPDAVRSRLSAQ